MTLFLAVPRVPYRSCLPLNDSCFGKRTIDCGVMAKRRVLNSSDIRGRFSTTRGRRDGVEVGSPSHCSAREYSLQYTRVGNSIWSSFQVRIRPVPYARMFRNSPNKAPCSIS